MGERELMNESEIAMMQFDAAPPVPLGYPRLRVLTSDEIELAIRYSYVGNNVDPTHAVQRAGIPNDLEERPDDDLLDWRTRMYIIWFCYIFENFILMKRPLGAIEELIMEFKAQDVIDLPGRVLGTLYAGAGGREPISAAERIIYLERLQPHYEKAVLLLDQWLAADGGVWR